MTKHLIITDEWRVHSHVIEHKEIRVYQDDANDDCLTSTLTRLQGVFSGLDGLSSTDVPGNFDSLGLGDKFDKETFTIEPSDSSNDSITKRTSRKSLVGLGSKLSLGSKTLLGNRRNSFTTKLLGSTKPPADNGSKHPADTKKKLLNKKDSQDDKPEAIKTSKKADKQDLELKSEATPPIKSSKTKKKDEGNLKD